MYNAVFSTQVFYFQEVKAVAKLFFRFLAQVVDWQGFGTKPDRLENELGVIVGDLERVFCRFWGIYGQLR